MAARTITVGLPSGVLTDADLSDTAPQDLGTAASGVSTEASRADHVHDMPTAADVGAAAASQPTAVAALEQAVSTADPMAGVEVVTDVVASAAGAG